MKSLRKWSSTAVDRRNLRKKSASGSIFSSQCRSSNARPAFVHPAWWIQTRQQQKRQQQCRGNADTTSSHATTSAHLLFCRWLRSSHITTTTLLKEKKNSPSPFPSSAAPQHQHNNAGGLNIILREVSTPQKHTHAHTHYSTRGLSPSTG